ncbi:kinase-like domain-containing protein [Parachaetomium inaequale]|uniref:Kinase-like domain-containing protein n=1 Tax=Parachaetomium inaequale TaxID=2588326 RepID=A0AAN6SK50_9PEZI|nr:kinase-like domain-containing protein [Parachaetomium inaequale]
MPAPPNRVIGSIRKINSCSWLIGGKLSQPLPEDTPDFQPRGLRFAPLSDPVGLVYSAGSSAAVWRSGDAFTKVCFLGSERANITREHTTLAFLHAKTAQQPLGFSIPNILYHAEWDNRYYLILSRVPGETLAKAWPAIDDTIRQHYIDRIADICLQLAERWKGESISGVDGRELADAMLAKIDNPQSFAPQRLHAHCAKMGMDVNISTKPVFYHCDLGPTNILVDPSNNNPGVLGIIDWETAGYVPREWVRTKFHLSSGMDFPNGDGSWKTDWRRLVARKLAELGFEEVIDGWVEAGPMA